MALVALPPVAGMVFVAWHSSARAGMLSAMGVGLLAAVGIAWSQRSYSRRVGLSCSGDEVIGTDWRGRRVVVGRRAAGRVVMIESVRGGTPAKDQWLVWLDDAGRTTWTTRRDTWKLDEVDALREHLAIPNETLSEPLKVAEIAERFPGAAPWSQQHFNAIMSVGFLALFLVVGVLEAVFDG